MAGLYVVDGGGVRRHAAPLAVPVEAQDPEVPESWQAAYDDAVTGRSHLPLLAWFEANTGIAGLGLTEADMVGEANVQETLNTAWFDTYGRYDANTDTWIVENLIFPEGNRRLAENISSNILFRGCIAVGGSNWWLRTNDVADPSKVRIEYCDLTGRDNPVGSGYLTSGGCTHYRNNISHAQDGIRANSGSTITECYIHDLYMFGDDPHNDGIQCTSGTGITVERSYIQAIWHTQTAGMLMAGNTNPLVDCDLIDNYVSGGGYAIYFVNGPSQPAPTGRILRNLFHAEDGLPGADPNAPTINPNNGYRYGRFSLASDRSGIQIAGNRYLLSGDNADPT